ncbi:MAG: DUF4238 domain-containing protein [Solirubrobacterales bacterium]
MVAVVRTTFTGVAYPTVNRSHIVPRCYLKHFAVDGQAELHVVGRLDSVTTSIDNVCVRRAFYSRTRPKDGARIDDVEASLAALEEKVAPLLTSIEADWPPNRDEKAILAEFFGVQLLRSPAWHQWYDEYTRNALAEARERGGTFVDGEFVASTEDELREVEEWILSDTQRLIRMLSMNPRAKTLLGSTRWNLIRFNAPVLATSDHPLIAWPLGEHGRKPGPTSFAWGLANMLEVAMPVTARLAILMTWGDSGDGLSPLPGRRHHAKTLNAFVIGQAEKQWLHVPDVSPPIGAGTRLPLSAEFVPGYGPDAALRSKVREQAVRLVNERVGSTLSDEAFIVEARAA